MGLDKASVLRVRSTLPSNKNTKTEKAVHLELDEKTTYPFISQTCRLAKKTTHGILW